MRDDDAPPSRRDGVVDTENNQYKGQGGEVVRAHSAFPCFMKRKTLRFPISSQPDGGETRLEACPLPPTPRAAAVALPLHPELCDGTYVSVCVR